MSGVPGPLPWIEYAGVEIANAARTVDYLAAGLLSSSSGVVTISPGGYPCEALRRDGGHSSAVPFVSPVVDPAPWYTAEVPASAEFLGFVPTSIDGALDSKGQRSMAPRLGGIEGGQLSPQHYGPREVPVKGYVYGTSAAGIEYGMRWLAERLAATDCDQCRAATMRLRAYCPPADGSEDEDGLYIYYGAGALSGPTETKVVLAERNCDVREVEFTLALQNPFIYKEPVDVTPPLGHAIELDAPDLGILGTIVTISVHFDDPRGSGPTLIGMWEGECPPDLPAIDPWVTQTLYHVGDGVTGSDGGFYSCYREHISGDENEPVIGAQYLAFWSATPGIFETGALAQMVFPVIPAGAVLVIDSAQRSITLTDADGVVSDGKFLLDIPPTRVFQWLEVDKCQAETVCFDVLGFGYFPDNFGQFLSQIAIQHRFI